MSHGELTEAWRVNAGLTLSLLSSIPPAALADRYSPKTRTVASQFAHIHNVRVSQLENRGGDVEGLASYARGAEPKKRELTAALKASGAAITKLLESIEAEGKVKSWSGRPPATYLGYLVSHESHHRGLVLVSLRAGGHKLPTDVTYGLWGA